MKIITAKKQKKLDELIIRKIKFALIAEIPKTESELNAKAEALFDADDVVIK